MIPILSVAECVPIATLSKKQKFSRYRLSSITDKNIPIHGFTFSNLTQQKRVANATLDFLHPTYRLFQLLPPY